MITSKQYHLMKKIERSRQHCVESTALTSDELNVCYHLVEQGYLDFNNIHLIEPESPNLYLMNESGRVQMEVRRMELRHWRIPVLISLIALAMSGLSLILQLT